MSSGGGGGSSMASIPNKVRKMIRDIKEIAGNHSDDDIYAVLQDCNMDPNETIQKLLYLDTFHEVKKKRDRRKVNRSSRTSEESRSTPGTPWRGARGSQGNYSSSYVSKDAGGGRKVGVRKENGVNYRSERGSRASKPVGHITANDATSFVSSSSTVLVNGLMSSSIGSCTRGSSLESPTGVYSASDPVLLLSENFRNPSAVGTLRSDIGSQSVLTESSAILMAGSRSSAGQDVANISQTSSVIVSSTERTSPRRIPVGVETNQLSESSQPSSFLSHDRLLTVISNQDVRLPKQLKALSKETAVSSEPASVAVVNLPSLPEVNDCMLEEATSKLEMKLEKINISAQQSVIFPSHLQVPEAFRNELTFGSLDATFGGKGSTLVHEAVYENNNTAGEPPFSKQIVSTTQEDDYTDHQQSPPHIPENISPSEDDISSGEVLKYDQSKQEMRLPLEGSQYPLLQTAPAYSFGPVPPLVGPHAVQYEGPELQNGSSPVQSTSGSTPPANHPMGAGQNSIAVPPQPFPFYRLPYPSNYFPYGPYFPQFYLPQTAHQFLAHSGFPHQSPSGNVYIPPTVPASGVKFPFPSLYKQGNNGGNPSPFGLPSGYGSYCSFPVGYSSSAALTPGSSCEYGNEGRASELKENNLYSAVQQSEESHGWTTAQRRDTSDLQANYFNNLPHGQHVPFFPAQDGHGAFSGIYHPAQAMAASSTVQPILQHSQAMAESVQSLVLSSGAHQQSQHTQFN